MGHALMHSLLVPWHSSSSSGSSSSSHGVTQPLQPPPTQHPHITSPPACRKAAVSGSEPADAIRAVNALLTRLDQLRASPNVMVLTTSNITEAIDLAFVDRADIKAYIGNPNLQARWAGRAAAALRRAACGLCASAGWTTWGLGLLPGLLPALTACSLARLPDPLLDHPLAQV
jgi:hypothetical protein